MGRRNVALRIAADRRTLASVGRRFGIAAPPSSGGRFGIAGSRRRRGGVRGFAGRRLRSAGSWHRHIGDRFGISAPPRVVKAAAAAEWFRVQANGLIANQDKKKTKQKNTICRLPEGKHQFS
ncbi:hypothetical protein ACP70R_004455 [Stipagrostis hirtigluma subsp. patula]